METPLRGNPAYPEPRSLAELPSARDGILYLTAAPVRTDASDAPLPPGCVNYWFWRAKPDTRDPKWAETAPQFPGKCRKSLFAAIRRVSPRVVVVEYALRDRMQRCLDEFPDGATFVVRKIPRGDEKQTATGQCTNDLWVLFALESSVRPLATWTYRRPSLRPHGAARELSEAWEYGLYPIGSVALPSGGRAFFAYPSADQAIVARRIASQKWTAVVATGLHEKLHARATAHLLLKDQARHAIEFMPAPSVVDGRARNEAPWRVRFADHRGSLLVIADAVTAALLFHGLLARSGVAAADNAVRRDHDPLAQLLGPSSERRERLIAESHALFPAPAVVFAPI